MNKTIHVENKLRSTESNPSPNGTIWIQPDLFEVAGIYEESCGGSLDDFSDLIPSTCLNAGAAVEVRFF